jgi:uncharacterized protein (UPF0335 family)
MALDQELLIRFADDIEILEERKKDASKTVTEAFDGFCKEHDGIKKKALKTAVKNYIKKKADGKKFDEEVNDVDVIFEALTKAFA